jgi:S1-C subfamily serine protease
LFEFGINKKENYMNRKNTIAIAGAIMILTLGIGSYRHVSVSADTISLQQERTSIGAATIGAFLIESVTSSGVAEKQGLKTGQIIYRADGWDFASVAELEKRLATADKERITLSIAAYKEAREIQIPAVKKLTDAGITGSLVFWVQEIVAKSPAEKAGLRTGDLISKLDGHSFLSVEDFAKFGFSPSGSKHVFEVTRFEKSDPSSNVLTLARYQVEIPVVSRSMLYK